MSIRRFHSRRRRGANAVEFGMTLPMFVMVLFGMMEFGWYFSRMAHVNGVLASSCREGALVDPVVGNCGDSCITTTVTNLLTSNINSQAGLTCSDCSAVVTGNVPERVVSCKAEVTYTPITGFIPVDTLIPTKIRTETQVRLEWQRVSF